MRLYSKQIILIFMLKLYGTTMAQFSGNANAIKAIAAMDTIRDTTTLANMRSKHDALVKDGWDIISNEKHKEFVVISTTKNFYYNKKQRNSLI